MGSPISPVILPTSLWSILRKRQNRKTPKKTRNSVPLCRHIRDMKIWQSQTP